MSKNAKRAAGRAGRETSLLSGAAAAGQFINRGIFPILLGFVALFVISCLISESFFQTKNLMNVLRQVSTNSIISVGMTFVILTGGIDLSVGSVVALTAVVVASMQGFPAFVAVIAGLLIGVLCGFLSGVVIVTRKLQPFIVTLAMMTIVKGAAFIYSGGRPIIGVSHGLESLASSYLGPIPFPAIYMVIIVIIAFFLLQYTYYGRSVYAVGGNEEAATLSGTRSGFVKVSVYMISGLLSAFAAIVNVARVEAGEPILGDGWELSAIASVAIGGTSMSGGVGNLIGTLIGALILGVLNNMFNLLNISPYIQQVVRGVIILAAVLATTNKK
jgi:ribose/xylose/arabinose/galactoside ABC-type transport system permease subunit